MSSYLGDFRTGKTIRKMWNSNAIAGESITRATNGTVSVYKDGGTTQSTAGVTDTEDFDSLTGVHLVAIDTSADGTFYSAGSDFEVVLSAATIDGKTINATLFSFSLENRSALMPTTDGRKLTIESDGMAHADLKEWLASAPLALASQRVVSDVGAISGDSAAADNLEAYTDGTTPMPVNATQISGDTTAADNAESFFDGTGYVGTNNTIPAVTTVNGLANNVITANTIANDAITAAKIATDAIGASELATDAVNEIRNAITGYAGALGDGSGRVTVNDLTVAFLAKLFTEDSGELWSDAVEGSLVHEIARRVWWQQLGVSYPGFSYADNLNSMHSTIGDIMSKLPDATWRFGQVSGTPTTTAIDSGSFSLPFEGNILNGCYLVFTTGDMKSVARVIETHTYDGTTHFTFAAEEAWPEAPAVGNQFVVMGRPGLTAAQVNAEADIALADYDAPTKDELDTAQTAITDAIDGLNDISAASVVAAIKADTEWATILANAEGNWILTPPGAFPGTGTLVLKNKANDTTLVEFDLTFNTDKVVTQRENTGP